MTATTRTAARTTDLDVGLLILRAAPGLLLAVRGAHELLGWFGGGTFAADAHYYGSIGYKPANLWAIVSGVTEMGGGLLLALGLFTPLAAAAVMGVMLNAVVAGQIPYGFISSGGDLVSIVGTSAIAVAFTGPGRLSLDGDRRWLGRLNPTVFSLVLGLGLGGIVLIVRALT
ncbi:MAG TPA: DoxX family protein [Pseudonocardiaceae bacterium]|nr:DoxX family protein [Pseudonocardiaceae bacterium]